MQNLLFDTLLGPHQDNKKTFLCLQNGSTVSFHDFVEQTARFAHALTNLGLHAGDRVAMQVGKSPDALAVYTAAIQSGIVFLPLNTAYTPSEVAYFVENSAAKLIICDPGGVEELQPIADQFDARLCTMDAAGNGSFKQASIGMPGEFPTKGRGGDDLAAILYTSGTTGRSKGAMLTQNNLLTNAQTLVDAWEFDQTDNLLHALPIFHTHGLFVATNTCLLSGAAMTFLPGFNRDHVIDALPNCTSMMGVPTFYTRLLQDPRLDKKLVSNIRVFISGSAPLLSETHRAFADRTGHQILERYGMTETNMNTSNPLNGARKAGTVGLPLPGIEIRIADPDTSQTKPDGETGIVEVRGPNVFSGYWRMPEKTAEEFHQDGFFITGDLGYLDSDGYLVIVGRAKDLIISGGFNIYPKEVELVLDSMPGILESAVIGVPHSDFGEGVVGIIVEQPGSSLDIEFIKDAASEQLANFKRPKKLITVPELPRNAMGKVQKNVLRDRFSGTFME